VRIAAFYRRPVTAGSEQEDERALSLMFRRGSGESFHNDVIDRTNGF
jgi:hypothetical protein